jgi:hypothetical protein
MALLAYSVKFFLPVKAFKTTSSRNRSFENFKYK